MALSALPQGLDVQLEASAARQVSLLCSRLIALFRAIPSRLLDKDAFVAQLSRVISNLGGQLRYTFQACLQSAPRPCVATALSD